jgi:hypothetical protein
VKTATIQIGNSDGKLDQREWSGFASQAGSIINSWGSTTHFAGAAPATSRWQNACWVIEIPDEDVEGLKGSLANLAKVWRQDSIALTLGETEMVGPQ